MNDFENDELDYFDNHENMAEKGIEKINIMICLQSMNLKD